MVVRTTNTLIFKNITFKITSEIFQLSKKKAWALRGILLVCCVEEFKKGRTRAQRM